MVKKIMKVDAQKREAQSSCNLDKGEVQTYDTYDYVRQLESDNINKERLINTILGIQRQLESELSDWKQSARAEAEEADNLRKLISKLTQKREAISSSNLDKGEVQTYDELIKPSEKNSQNELDEFEKWIDKTLHKAIFYHDNEGKGAEKKKIIQKYKELKPLLRKQILQEEEERLGKLAYEFMQKHKAQILAEFADDEKAMAEGTKALDENAECSFKLYLERAIKAHMEGK